MFQYPWMDENHQEKTKELEDKSIKVNSFEELYSYLHLVLLNNEVKLLFIVIFAEFLYFLVIKMYMNTFPMKNTPFEPNGRKMFINK